MPLRHTDPRMLFGFLVVVIIAVLAAFIALGKVHQESSFGLQILLGSLSTLAGSFAAWAFSSRSDKGD